MSVELGNVRGDRRKEILERQAVSELEQEKALHQLAVERANRACERADAAEAERDAAREALARVEALADELDTLAKTLIPCTGSGCPGCRLGVAVSRLRAALTQPATDEGAGLPLHRTEAGYPNCSTCDGGGCLDCTDPA